MTSEAGLIWCPFADEESAREVIAGLLAERLIACGNILPGVQSLYFWHGAQDSAGECGSLLKTSAPLLDRAMERLEALHPYDRPAVMGWLAATTPATAQWLETETAAK
ncbi:divalent-cation tolerance protein CutA [Qipengyuania spongiae]|uniref:Divalent-cation tolerance protein CutA n=1 Tax=Qipengyuania spongiae TaxID=2909673 RepID=A0ABY5T3J6_9SPHN|nr:divalent-cation tolerance protein CutA [Qipengyuania spongiae]UVI39916.1 divalent-cation tolerance protein CutA [Qipengyuania spongiae]